MSTACWLRRSRVLGTTFRDPRIHRTDDRVARRETIEFVGESVVCPMGYAHISAKRDAPGSNTAYHRPASCSPSLSWWNILATGAQPTSIIRGNTSHLSPNSPGSASLLPAVRSLVQRSSPPRPTGRRIGGGSPSWWSRAHHCAGIATGSMERVVARWEIGALWLGLARKRCWLVGRGGDDRCRRTRVFHHDGDGEQDSGQWYCRV
jgi:hypothetical protein